MTRLVITLVLAFSVGPVAGQDNGPCLDKAYPKVRPSKGEIAFDTKYDNTNRNGWSFSCGPEIAASEARKALESFRYGVLYDDKAHLDGVLRFPLSVRIRKTRAGSEQPRVVTVHNTEEWAALQKSEMTKTQIAMIACSWLGNVTVATGRSPGFFIGDGMVWFQGLIGGSKVWVTSLNLGPMTADDLARLCSTEP